MNIPSIRRTTTTTILCMLALLGMSACRGTDNSDDATDPSKTIPFEKEGELTFVQNGDSTVTIDVEIADTDSSRERGMMEREGFPNDRSGMLFVFNQEQPRSFWMANTPVALDIFFVSADSQIVSIAKYTTPYSSEQIESEGPARYVLETPAGFADSHGLIAGDRITWTRMN